MPGKSVSERKQQTNSGTDYEDREVLPSSVEEKIPDNKAWETQLLQVYGEKATLKYPQLKPGEVTMEHELNPRVLPLQEGVTVAPTIAQVSVYGGSKSDAPQGVIFTALGGQVELAVSNFDQAKTQAELATMNIVTEKTPAMDQTNMEPIQIKADQTMNQTDETEISAYLRDSVVLEPIEGIHIELSQGEYIRKKNDPNPKLKFWKTKLVIDTQNTEKDFETELDQTGLHISEGQAVQLDEQEKGNTQAAQVLERLTAVSREPEKVIAEEPKIEECPEEEQPKEEEKEEKRKEFTPGDVTADGFVKMEEAEYDPVKEGNSPNGKFGKGKFSFQEIPYHIPVLNNKELQGTTRAKAADEDVQTFYVDSQGRLNVTFSDPIELQLIGDDKIGQYLVTKIKLEQVSVSNSYLTARKIRIDLGVASRQSDDKEESKDKSEENDGSLDIAKKLFGENIHGTFAYIGAVNNIDKTGIHASTGKKSLGGFGVSEFLGFLDVEGDYPTGHLQAGFEKKRNRNWVRRSCSLIILIIFWKMVW